ncbi:class I SAM-dependent methyltransferase [Miniphocaeibacter halophilus]|uniref:Class I SAM-dependent methyltransferase n=1 Tax=Miniphocaeibacter halophilus TaxID=2931922 RepID=A0AC61MMD6_9FIRM|nr:class I SAM-dependent methyltransferase [Miniphocaeibacter halophilus]QQK06890.1 class I SAM-dependent methyltransferase [Miniphocaeibacter halophilus]
MKENSFEIEKFNSWAKNYNRQVRESDEENKYPFAAYENIQNRIKEYVLSRRGKNILDIGIGTGTLAKLLYDKGCNITGIDFSKEMLEKTKTLIPTANLINWDFTYGLPEGIKNNKFDIIICNYAIHHLKDNLQKLLLEEAFNILKEEGTIIIADIITETKKEMEVARTKDINIWDDDEYYLIYDNIKSWFINKKISFEKYSYCSGILFMTKK